jgi:hypothetical protein
MFNTIIYNRKNILPVAPSRSSYTWSFAINDVEPPQFTPTKPSNSAPTLRTMLLAAFRDGSPPEHRPLIGLWIAAIGVNFLASVLIGTTAAWSRTRRHINSYGISDDCSHPHYDVPARRRRVDIEYFYTC